MNEELFNEAAKSNVLTKKLIDQLQESKIGRAHV